MYLKLSFLVIFYFWIKYLCGIKIGIEKFSNKLQSEIFKKSSKIENYQIYIFSKYKNSKVWKFQNANAPKDKNSKIQKFFWNEKKPFGN